MAKLEDVILGIKTVFGAAAIGTFGVTVAKALNSSNYTTTNPSGMSYNNQSTVIFPNDLINISSGRISYMIFSFYQYQRPSIYEVPNKLPVGTIILPLPSDLVDAQHLSYHDNEKLGPALGASMDAIAKGISNENQIGHIDFQNALATLGQGTLVGGGLNVADAVLAKLGTNKEQVLQLGGLSVNPFMTVLFDSPTFKRHEFRWKFIPKNQGEADTIKFIINKFRYHSLPDRSDATAGTLLRYPDMVIPTISPTGYVYSFKHCMIEDCVTNYAPGSTPSFTRDALSPSAISFSIKLLEIEYWVKKDLLTSDLNYSIPSNLDLATVQSQSSSGTTTNPNISNVLPNPSIPGKVTTSLQEYIFPN